MMTNSVTLAINDLITSNNYILINKNNLLKQQIEQFNISIINIQESELIYIITFHCLGIIYFQTLMCLIYNIS